MLATRKKMFVEKEEVYAYFQNHPAEYAVFEHMHPLWREKLVGYMIGKKTLPFTYDPFFKMVFHPEEHPERLSDFISAVVGEELQVERALTVEHVLHDGRSIVIMDLLVRLSNGGRANVEIQKYAEGFPDQRMNCYAADNVMQEYQVAKAAAGEKKFSYRDVGKVYTIVIYERSSQKYKKPELKGAYWHHGYVTFNTGVKLDLLEEYYVINLDIFKDNTYTRENNRLNGWLSFLTTENTDDVENVIKNYPWLQTVYEEAGACLLEPEEALAMYSDALRILDNNSMELFYDELVQKKEEAEKQLGETEKQLGEAEKQLGEAEKQCNKLTEEKKQLTRENDEMKRQLEELKKKLAEYE